MVKFDFAIFIFKMKKYYLSTLVAFVSFAFLVFDISNYSKEKNVQHIETVSDNDKSTLPKSNDTYCCHNDYELFTPQPQKTEHNAWLTIDQSVNSQINKQIENQNRLKNSLF